MTFGVCCSLSDAPAILDAGFDSVELSAAALLDNLSAYQHIRPYSTNLFFPGSIRLFGPEANDWRPYVNELLPAAASCGVQVMVVGSSGSRRAPDGWSADDGNRAFAEVIAEAQTLATAYGITLAPEALNRKEANLGVDLRSLAEALLAVGCSYTADSYHSLVEADLNGTPIDWAEELPASPAHVHISCLQRQAPTETDESLIAFAVRLRTLGFDRHVSIEGHRPSDFPSCLPVWRVALVRLFGV